VTTDLEEIARLKQKIEELKAENKRLRRALEEALRAGKRQAAGVSRRPPTLQQFTDHRLFDSAAARI